jgi:hypothetical protein
MQALTKEFMNFNKFAVVGASADQTKYGRNATDETKADFPCSLQLTNEL